MNDLNFFEPYIIPKKQPNIKLFVVVGMVAFIMVFAIGYFFYINHRIKLLQQDTDRINQIISSAETQKKAKIIDQKKEELRSLESGNQQLKELQEYIEYEDIVDDVLMNHIVAELPKYVFFQDISIEGQQIEIQGTAENRLAIAQFEYNLRHTSYFNNVFVSAFMKDEGDYTFNATFNLKDVSGNEVK